MRDFVNFLQITFQPSSNPLTDANWYISLFVCFNSIQVSRFLFGWDEMRKRLLRQRGGKKVSDRKLS